MSAFPVRSKRAPQCSVNRQTFHRRLAFVALAATLSVTSRSAGAARALDVDSDAASDVTPPPGLTVVRRVQAGGAQLYTCRAVAEGAFGWALIGPKALLFNADGSDFGTHMAGPRWTAVDGSSIVADGAHPLARVERAGSVPALLLRVVATTGAGLLADVKEVTRTETDGGQAPPAGCDAAHAGATIGERYTAVYTFYR